MTTTRHDDAGHGDTRHTATLVTYGDCDGDTRDGNNCLRYTRHDDIRHGYTRYGNCRHMDIDGDDILPVTHKLKSLRLVTR